MSSKHSGGRSRNNTTQGTLYSRRELLRFARRETARRSRRTGEAAPLFDLCAARKDRTQAILVADRRLHALGSFARPNG